MKRICIAIMAGVMIFVIGCQAEIPQATTEQWITLTVMTHNSFQVSEKIIRQFEAENHVTIQFLKYGDTGQVVNLAILNKNTPLADVLYGVDNTFLSRALSEGIFEPYASPLLASVPDEFRLDAENFALPVDYGDVCINYDRGYFAEKALPLPSTLADLLKPVYKDLLVVENPATSSPGLAFLLATVAEFDSDGYLDYWLGLKENGVVIVNDWETAYYTNFSGSSGHGLQPLVVSYNSSPVAEVVYADQPLTEAPTASLTAPGMCFRQVEFVGILKGTSKRAIAERFVDFMLSTQFQEDMPLQMFVFPVDPQAELPGEYTQYVVIPETPAWMPPEEIAANRDVWIEQWTEIMLR